MKKIDLGQTIAILANLGVVAGIVFLAVEIRENRQQAIVANSLQGSNEIALWMRSLAEDPDLAALYQRGASSFRDLSAEEKFRFDSLVRSGLLQISLVEFARSSELAGVAPGTADDRVIEGNLLRMFENEGVKEWWNQADRRGIPLPTRQIIDELVRLSD